MLDKSHTEICCILLKRKRFLKIVTLRSVVFLEKERNLGQKSPGNLLYTLPEAGNYQ
jgi:hypothetical protein